VSPVCLSPLSVKGAARQDGPWGSLAHQKARSGRNGTSGARIVWLVSRPAEAGGPSPRSLTRRAPPKRGIEEPSGGFGLLVDGALGNLGEGFISSLLFLKCLLEKRHGVFKAKLFRPSDKRPVAGDFIVFNRLRGG
jgi:hypothetical protein